MPWHTRLTVALVFAAAVFACGEQSEMQLTEPQAQIEGGPVCKLSDLKTAARSFVGNRSPGYALAEQFTNTNKNTAAVLPIFFDLAHQISVKAGAGLTEAQVTLGAEVHRQAVACAPVVDPDYTDDVASVKAALRAGGAYEVRGRTGTDNAVVLSHNTGQNGSSGIKAPPAGFNAWTGGAVIFYGFTQGATLGGEAPADPFAPATFQWFTVRPAGAEYSTLLRGVVGICVSTNAIINSFQLRVQHEDGDDAVVLPVTNFDVCTASSPTHSTRLSPIVNALAWLQQRLAPAPLQAATALATTSPSGSIKKFSPVEAVNPGGATLAFVPSVIPNTAVNAGLGIKVSATGAGGVPWEGLLIKLVPFDNNGDFALVPDTATTDAEGLADFTGSILDKPGGYLLLAITQPGADADAAAFTQDSVISQNRFNRTPN
jgi:hypothetical protein